MHMVEEAQGPCISYLCATELIDPSLDVVHRALADNSQQPSTDKPSQTVGRPLIHVKNACRARRWPFVGS